MVDAAGAAASAEQQLVSGKAPASSPRKVAALIMNQKPIKAETHAKLVVHSHSLHGETSGRALSVCSAGSRELSTKGMQTASSPARQQQEQQRQTHSSVQGTAGGVPLADSANFGL